VRLGGRVHTLRLSETQDRKKEEENENKKENNKKKRKKKEEKEERGALELGAQWIHGRGENPLWKFCLHNQLPIRQVNVYEPITGLKAKIMRLLKGAQA
jgi:hypothetical protein